MSYNYITKYSSPNFTGGRTQAVREIAIHWWGAPESNQTFEGVVSWLCNRASGVSATFVATGTGRRVAQLVNLSDTSWATVQANPWTISIECDPRCRDEDYDVVAELIANIRSVYGNIPLVPHNKYFNTRCPGDYNLARLDALANTKDGSGDWGVVTNKINPTDIKNQIAQAYSEILERSADAGGIDHYYMQMTQRGWSIHQVRADLMASGERKQLLANKQAAALAAQQAAERAAREKAAADKMAADKKAKELAEEQAKAAAEQAAQIAENGKVTAQDKINDETNKRLTALEKIVQSIVEFLSNIFSGFKK